MPLPPLPASVGRIRLRYAPWTPEEARLPEDERPVPRVLGIDSITGREVEVVRVPFGAARVAERDAFVADQRLRTSVIAPSLVAVHDAGEWGEDAFVATDAFGPTTPWAEHLPSLDAKARVEVARQILVGLAALEHAGLGLTDSFIRGATFDRYGVLRLAGVDSLPRGPFDFDVVRWMLEALMEFPAGSVDGRPDQAAMNALAGLAGAARATGLAEAAQRLGVVAEERPLVDASAPKGDPQRQVLLVGVGLFVLAFVVLVLALLRARNG